MVGQRFVVSGFKHVWLSVTMTVSLTGCGVESATLPRGDLAYSVIPASNANARPANYRIGPFDVIDITVFQEPDLTMKGVQVDAAGKILVPLIGSVQAAGETTNDLSIAISTRLEQKFLQEPQVSISVTSSVSQKVTVEGSVVEAGVFEIKGQTSLLEALALAKGLTRTAALNQVAVFRNVDGKRSGAVFDVGKIRHGDAEDPAILGDDVIVVGFSSVKGAYRDFLQTAPVLAIFRTF